VKPGENERKKGKPEIDRRLKGVYPLLLRERKKGGGSVRRRKKSGSA